jgi:nucleotide-binding universal stress UspA family protein
VSRLAAVARGLVNVSHYNSVMHVLIATTGVLSPEPAIRFAARLVGDEGRVTVTTVVEVPRSFLNQLRSESWHPLDETTDGQLLATDEATIARYVDERGTRLTEPVVQGLRAAGLDAEAVFTEGEDPVLAISTLAAKIDADVVVLGATRQLFDQSAWESVSARIMIESGKPVLVLPPERKERQADDQEQI